MTTADPKDVLRSYLQTGREALLWKLEGLDDYDVRRPMTSTGTNLLGLVKHLASIELGYLGDCFGRPSGEPLPWFAPDAEPNADMWATAEESRAGIEALYRRAWAHADETIAALPLDAPGRVPWWPKGDPVTLQRVVVHVSMDTHRHAGQADLVRELIDGSAGFGAGNPNLAPGDARWWSGYCARLEQVARQAGDRS